MYIPYPSNKRCNNITLSLRLFIKELSYRSHDKRTMIITKHYIKLFPVKMMLKRSEISILMGIRKKSGITALLFNHST